MFAQTFDVLGTVLALALRVGDDTVPGIKEVQTIQGGELLPEQSSVLEPDVGTAKAP